MMPTVFPALFAANLELVQQRLLQLRWAMLLAALLLIVLGQLAGLALPLVLVVALGIAAIVLCRRGKRDWAGLCAIAPWPLTLIAYSALGAI